MTVLVVFLATFIVNLCNVKFSVLAYDHIEQLEKDIYKFYYNAENIYTKNLEKESLNLKIKYDGKIKDILLKNDHKLTKIRSELLNSGYESRISAMEFAFNNGFSYEQAIKYCFPELYIKIEELCKKEMIEPQNASIEIIKNSGKIRKILSEKGINIDKNTLFKDVFYKLINYNELIDLKIPTYEVYPEIKEVYADKLKASFKTTFTNSSESRKNNIKKALSCFDGILLNPGQTLSFNDTTGVRNEQNGYMKAKIIKNGAFVEEFGGGVCQVSTTIYNAALLAGLEIVEVNPHSLPVSYIEPCFDAMVNMGSSDLIIKNNTKEAILFATSYLNDECLVNIYGEENKYKVVRRSKKVEELNEILEEKTSDYKRFGLDEELEPGKEIILNYGKPGFKALGYLDYYKDDILIKTKENRVNTYKPTKKIILISEKT